MTVISPLKLEKDELRKKYKKLRKDIPKDEKIKADTEICRRITKTASFRYAEYVLFYAATDDEISLDYLVSEALSAGKKVLFPRCNTEERTMTYHFVTDLDELSPDSYGIREPAPASPVYDPEIHTGSALCLVPGLLFDKNGYRLGYGGGYYDRFLSSFKGNRIGIVYRNFVTEKVPRGRYDVQMDVLITENKAIIIKKAENEN